MSKVIPFSKMQGCGNDYIYFNCLKEPLSLSVDQIIALSDRHFGIGGDGVIMILPSRTCDFAMRMFNADGSEGEMCGNGVRCAAKLLYDKGFTAEKRIVLETRAGPKTLELKTQGGTVESVRVDMGEPILEAARIPTASSKDRVVDEVFEQSGRSLRLTCVSMGNPHAVFFVDRITDDLVLGLGPKIEKNPFFPARTNVEFVQIIDRQTLAMRVWERGSGETLACGTGACAVAAAAVLNGRTVRKVQVQLRGGELEIEWAADNHIYMTGPAAFTFEGTVEID